MPGEVLFLMPPKRERTRSMCNLHLIDGFSCMPLACRCLTPWRPCPNACETSPAAPGARTARLVFAASLTIASLTVHGKTPAKLH